MADYKSTHTGAEIDAGIDKAVTADTNWSLLMANLGIGRWANQTFVSLWSGSTISDNLLGSYTNVSRYIQNAQYYDNAGEKLMTDQVVVDIKTPNSPILCYSFAEGFQNTSLLVKNARFQFAYNCFWKCPNLERLEFENVTFEKLMADTFGDCPKLKYIGSADLSTVTAYSKGLFNGDTSLEEIHLKHFKVSFSIQDSTKFTNAALNEIISNLDPVTTTQTLTMGTTNLAKLTDAEKKVATDKGWVLA